MAPPPPPGTTVMIELASSVLGLINARPYVKLYMPRYIHGGKINNWSMIMRLTLLKLVLIMSLCSSESKLHTSKKYQVDFSSFNKLVGM